MFGKKNSQILFLPSRATFVRFTLVAKYSLSQYLFERNLFLPSHNIHSTVLCASKAPAARQWKGLGPNEKCARRLISEIIISEERTSGPRSKENKVGCCWDDKKSYASAGASKTAEATIWCQVSLSEHIPLCWFPTGRSAGAAKFFSCKNLQWITKL